jgi:hypothetical protein
MATSALNQLTGMPNLPLTRSLQQPAKTPKGYIGSAEIGPVLSELGEAETKAQLKVGEGDVAIEEAKRQEKGTEAEKKMLLTERLGQEAKDLPERKQLGEARQQLQEMAFAPSKETAQDLAAMFSLISVVGMVAGKGNSQLAMSAMNGMLEGHQKGRADLYRQQQIEFDKNFKAMQAKISTLEKGVTEAMELKKYDKEAGEQKMIMELAKADSPLLKAMKDKQGDVAVLNNVRSIRKDMDTLFKLNNDLQAKADARQDKKDRAQEAADLKKLLAEMSAGRKDQKLLDAIGPALRNIAEQYPDGTAMSLIGASPDDKKRVQGAYRAVEESEKVADFVARNPNAVGALAVAKNFLKVDAIKSLQSEDETTVAAGKSAIIDQQLDAGVQKGEISRDDAEAAKVLQKKLFALALADVQGSGQRGSVYLDRQFQNLYDQASRDTTLVKIIRERADENNRNLKTYKLNVERHNNPEQFPLLESRTTEDFIKERKPKSGVPENVEKALKGKPEASGVKSGGKTYRIYGGVVKEVQE